MSAQQASGADALEPNGVPVSINPETRLQLCLNCRAELTGPYSQRCGQSAHVHRTLAAVWHDLKHGMLHLDGKLARTLPLLALRPGELTRRYIAGERRAVVSPLAMFLFAVFTLFLIMQLFHVQFGRLDTDETVSASLVNTERQLMELSQGTSEGVSPDLAVLGGAATITRSSQAADTDDGATRADRAGRALPHLRAAMRLWGAPSVVDLRDSEVLAGGWWPMLEKALTDPVMMLYKFQANSYKFSWALIPLSVPFVWLLFARHRRFTAYDHTVFVTYSLAFATLLVGVLVLLGQAGVPNQALTLGLLLAMPLHQFLQLRGTYGLSKRGALWRVLVLQVLIGVILALFAALIVGVCLL